jgi:putative FmdB family regulatory protein
MPTYEYECKSCGHSFEVFQAMSEEPLKTCARCGKEVRRLIFGGAGVIFKGSGFYVTDKGTKVPGTAPAPQAAKTESKTAEKSPPAQSAPAPKTA